VKRAAREAEETLDGLRPQPDWEGPELWLGGSENANGSATLNVATSSRTTQIEGGLTQTVTSAAHPSSAYMASEVPM